MYDDWPMKMIENVDVPIASATWKPSPHLRFTPFGSIALMDFARPFSARGFTRFTTRTRSMGPRTLCGHLALSPDARAVPGFEICCWSPPWPGGIGSHFPAAFWRPRPFGPWGQWQQSTSGNPECSFQNMARRFVASSAPPLAVSCREYHLSWWPRADCSHTSPPQGFSSARERTKRSQSIASSDLLEGGKSGQRQREHICLYMHLACRYRYAMICIYIYIHASMRVCVCVHVCTRILIRIWVCIM